MGPGGAFSPKTEVAEGNGLRDELVTAAKNIPGGMTLRGAWPYVGGYACHLVMVSLLGWNGMLLFAPSGVDLGVALSSTDMAQAVVYPLAFLLVGALAWRTWALHRLWPSDWRSPLLWRRVAIAVLSLTAAVGGALFLGLELWGERAPLVAAVAGVLIGLSTAGLFMLWQLVFSQMETRRAAEAIIGGTFFAGAAFFVVMVASSAVVAVAAFVMCLAASAASLGRFLGDSSRRRDVRCTSGSGVSDGASSTDVLLFCSALPARSQDASDAVLSTCEHAGERAAAPSLAASAKELLRDLWQPALCIAALGFASGIAPLAFFGADTANAFNGMKALARMASAAILWVLWWRLYRRDDRYALFYVVTFPVVATGFVLLPFLGFDYQLTFSVVAYLIFSMASMLMMLLCAREAQVRHVSPLAVYGLFAGFVYLLNRLGKVFGSAQGYGLEFGFSQLLMMALLVIYVLSIVLLSTRFKGARGRARGEDASVDGAGEEHRACAGARAEADEAIADVPGSPMDSVAAEGNAVMEASGSAVHGFSSAGELPWSDSALAACVGLANRFELTPREAEVLGYLARGRNVTFISDKLVVSSNTVRAHCKAIYRKLGVHSRQELLSVVESESQLQV